MPVCTYSLSTLKPRGPSVRVNYPGRDVPGYTAPSIQISMFFFHVVVFGALDVFDICK